MPVTWPPRWGKQTRFWLSKHPIEKRIYGPMLSRPSQRSLSRRPQRLHEILHPFKFTTICKYQTGSDLRPVDTRPPYHLQFSISRSTASIVFVYRASNTHREIVANYKRPFESWHGTARKQSRPGLQVPHALAQCRESRTGSRGPSAHRFCRRSVMHSYNATSETMLTPTFSSRGWQATNLSPRNIWWKRLATDRVVARKADVSSDSDAAIVGCRESDTIDHGAEEYSILINPRVERRVTALSRAEISGASDVAVLRDVVARQHSECVDTALAVGPKLGHNEPVTIYGGWLGWYEAASLTILCYWRPMSRDWLFVTREVGVTSYPKFNDDWLDVWEASVNVSEVAEMMWRV